MEKNRGVVRAQKKEKQKEVDGVEGSAILAENRKVYGHRVPEQEVDMQQLIDNHEEGQLFPFLATTGEEVEPPGSRIERIMRFIPSMKVKRVKVEKRMDFVLRDETEHISLSKLIGDRVSMEFFSIPSILFAFSPTVSLRSDFTDIYVCLIDSRFRGRKLQQRMILSSNKHYKGEMCIDYSIPKESADSLEFCISSAVPILNTGEIWGALQAEFVLRESSFPEAIPFKEVMGAAAYAKTGLVEFNRDPTMLNLAILDDHHQELREMNERGEISDVATAHLAKETALTYSSSRINPRKGVSKEPTREDWEKLKKTTKTRAPQQSISPPASVEDARVEEVGSSSDIPEDAKDERVVLSEDSKAILERRKQKVAFSVTDLI